MAIIDGIPGIEVLILTTNGTAQEYDDPDHAQEVGENGTRFSCKFIESRSGQEFTIRINVSPTYNFEQPMPHILNLALYIDGQWVRGELCRKTDLRDGLRNGKFTMNIKNRVTKNRDNTVVSQSFTFTKVATVDDTSNSHWENEQEKVRDLGIIELRVYRVQEFGSSTFKPDTEKARLSEIAEKSLKGRAISHGTEFSDAMQLAPLGTSSLRYRDIKRLPTDAGPLAIYRFKYRSREGLRQEAIIPHGKSEARNQARGQTDPRRQSVVSNMSPPAVVAAPSPAVRAQEELRKQAYERLRNLGVDVARFRGHRERARAAQRAQQNKAAQHDSLFVEQASRAEPGRGGGGRVKEELIKKEEPVKKEEGSPTPGQPNCLPRKRGSGSKEDRKPSPSPRPAKAPRKTEVIDLTMD